MRSYEADGFDVLIGVFMFFVCLVVGLAVHAAYTTKPVVGPHYEVMLTCSDINPDHCYYHRVLVDK